MSEPKGWNAEKQARYEAFMQAEKEAEQAEADRLETERTANDLAFDASVPEAEAPAPDEWEETLAKIETMPNVPGSLIRVNGHINVTTVYLLEEILGIRRDSHDNNTKQDEARLATVMTTLGWTKPKNVWTGVTARKGYRKQLWKFR